MTFTTQDLANLRAALVSGALEVQIGDRRIKYRSLAEIQALIRAIEISIADEVPEESPDIIKATFSKGGS